MATRPAGEGRSPLARGNDEELLKPLTFSTNITGSRRKCSPKSPESVQAVNDRDKMSIDFPFQLQPCDVLAAN